MEIKWVQNSCWMMERDVVSSYLLFIIICCVVARYFLLSLLSFLLHFIYLLIITLPIPFWLLLLPPFFFFIIINYNTPWWRCSLWVSSWRWPCWLERSISTRKLYCPVSQSHRVSPSKA